MAVTAALVKELRERTGLGMLECQKALVETNGSVDEAIENLRKSGQAKAAKKAGRIASEGSVIVKASDDGKVAIVLEVNSETDFVARDESFNAFVQKVANLGLANKAPAVAATLAITDNGQALEVARQALISKLGENIQLRRVAYIESNGCIGHYSHGDRIGVVVALDTDNQELARDIAMHIAATNPLALTPEDVSPELMTKEREIFAAQAKESGKPQAIIDKMIDGRVNKFLKEVSLTSQPFVKDPNISVADLLKQHNTKIKSFVRFEVGEGIEKETQNFADEVMAQVQGKD